MKELVRKAHKFSNSNIKARNPKQYQMSKIQNSKQKSSKLRSFEHWSIGILNLFRISDLEFRISHLKTFPNGVEITAWSVILACLLILPGCKTARSNYSQNDSREMQAEANLASSQSQAMIQEMAAAAAQATFQNGDKIAIQIWLKDKITQLSGFPLELLIPESGEVFLPHIGLVKLGGRTVQEVQSELQNILDKMLKDVTVIVLRKGEKTIGGIGPGGKIVSVELGRHFIVMGHISRPGLYPLESGLRVRDAIAVAGGVAHYGHPRIYLVCGDRAQPEVKRINLDDIFYGENLDENVLLTSNDAIYVAPKMLYTIADFITLLLSPVTAVRDSLYVYDRLTETSP
ncbi:MAG: polysaccharide biosynthesis/export family protein [Kiritimatiellae bacterium]|nr:polysaccharide biosynthesis/export family protein [Verrucomicrobiota bacterium]MBU4285345.1 polysaccharide biosynthesis/export family protein [Verrucomicrobiota bacterium]MCG2659324.1 polysaccharide biosynthesis/export family protein [Kiritimatiellia bacterium]